MVINNNINNIYNNIWYLLQHVIVVYNNIMTLTLAAVAGQLAGQSRNWLNDMLYDAVVKNQCRDHSEYILIDIDTILFDV